MKRITTLSILLLALASSAMPLAESATQGTGMNTTASTSHDATGAHKGTGVIKSIDPKTGAITLAHEPISSLNWSAMTMGFKVKDKQLAEKVRPGDKVDFTVVKDGNDYVLTSVVKKQ